MSSLTPVNGIRMVLALSGVVRVGHSRVLTAGEADFTLGAPLAVGGITGDAAVISIDTQLIPSGAEDSHRGLVRVQSRELSALLVGLVTQTGLAASARVDVSQALASALLGVISSLYVEENARVDFQMTRHRSSDVYSKALKVIRERLASPDLSPTVIAEACAVSTRYLHMLFKKHGETVSGSVLRERLERCRLDLSDQGLAETSISDIAARWGFNTPSHFSQKFRSTYGMTPREWRHAALKSA